MPAKSDPRGDREGERAGSQFYYRRALSGRDLLPAIGVGIAAGIFAFYVAHIYIQQTPLVPARKTRGLAKAGGADRPAPVPAPKRGG